MRNRNDVVGIVNEDVGGTSTAEYRDLLSRPYTNGTGSIILVENYHQILNSNPCKSGFGDNSQGKNNQ